MVGIPLLSGSEVLGALAIYAAEPDAFDEDEVQLLRELADDLSYGIDALRTRAACQRAEEALKRAHDELERRVEERTAELSRANTLLTREIADRERAEAALRTSERLYRQLTEGILEAIVVADERGRIKLFNPAAQRAFGYAEHEVLGQPLSLLMPPEDREAHEQALRHYVETRKARSIGPTTERQGRRKGGEVFPMELSLSAIELPEGIVFLGAIHDLTERRRMQAMIVQAEKLASLGLLSAGVAHEINNPLAYVANNLAVLERDCRGLSEVLEAYEQAHPCWRRPAPSLPGGLTRSVRRSTCPTSGRTWGGCSAAHGRGSSASPASWRTCGGSPGSIRPPSIGWTCSRRSPAAWS